MARHEAPDPARLLEHLDFARRLARGLVHDAGHAEDLVQDAWVVALEHPPREGGAGARAFLATLVRRLRARQLRGEERRERRERRVARAEAQPSSAALAASMEVHRRVVEALAELPEAQREALLLRFFEDLPPAAIAARLGLPVETVRTRVRRGLAGVRARLERGGERDWIPALVTLGRSPAGPGERPDHGVRRWLPRVGLVAVALFVAVLGVQRLRDVRSLYAVSPSVEERTLEAPDGAREPSAVPLAPGTTAPAERPRYAAADPAARAGSVTALRAAGYGNPERVRTAGLFGGLFSGLAREELPPLAQALGIELLDVLRIDPPSAAQRARVARATGASKKDVAAVALYQAVRLVDEDPRPVRVASVPLPDGFAGSAALLALGEEGRFLANAVVDHEGQAVEGWEHFLQGFVWAEVPRLEGARPRSWLAERRRELLARDALTIGRDDEQGRLTLALLRLLEQMNEQASAFNLPRGGHPLAPPQEAAMMAEAYRGVAALADDLQPLLGEVGEDFVRLALDSAASADALGAAFEAGDGEGAMQIRRQILANCHACHDLTGHRGEGPLKDASLALRRELGIGDGFYQLGHDLRIRHADREQAQVVADALRLAALSIDAAR